MATKQAKEPMVACQTPTRGQPGSRIEKWKYDLIKRAILACVPDDDIGIMYKQLPAMVRSFLSRDDRARLGAITYYTQMVKLDLEVRGEIQRIAGMRPQYLRRA